MKRPISTFLAAIISTVLYSQQDLASNLSSQCMQGVPNYDCPFLNRETDELSIIITAENVKGKYPDNATFTGNVDIKQGKSRLQANEVLLHQKQQNNGADPIRMVDALGDVHYHDNQIILKGQKAWLNLNTKDINVWKGDYQMVGRQGRGKADLIKQRDKNRYTILKNGSFTSCQLGSDTWSIVGSKVIHDHKKQVAKIWNARFKFSTIPVFYSPYLQLPMGDKRRSGLLSPSAKYSMRDSFEFNLPYYWNIAPNMDATITPNYICKHNKIRWKTEFRYLTQAGLGLMEFHYFPFNTISKDEPLTGGNHHRWLYYWQHSGLINQALRSNINYTKISDSYYFNELSSKYRFITDGYAAKLFSIGYARKNFDFSISKKQFQALNGQISNYSTNPQLDVNWLANNIGPFDIRIYGQAVRLINTNSDMPRAIRIHFEPTINLPWSKDWMTLDTELKLMATHYQQKNLDNQNNKNDITLEKLVNRTLPQFKVHAKVIFERDINLVNSYTQTLEPRIQYLWIPYRIQNKINNYDSSLLQSNYGSLFRDRSYGGLDYIPSTNQLTTSITSRIYDPNAIVERLNISIGQILYFRGSHIGDGRINWKNDSKIGSLIWASEAYWPITDKWYLRGGLEYIAHLNGITSSSAAMKYFFDKDRMVQLTYRYVSPKYLQEIEASSTMAGRCSQGISRVAGEVIWPITNRLSVVGACHFDTNTHKVANQKLGLQYNSCCHGIHIGYERKYTDLNGTGNQSKYDDVIGFNIELRGLNSNYSLETKQMLRSNIES